MKKATFKVTPKTTKAQLLQVLTANANNTEGVDQQTLDTAAYAVKNPDKATRSDLTSLVKSFMTALGDKFIVPAFAESKPKTEAKPETDEAPKPENLVKKTTSKTESKADKAKKPSDKKGAVTVLEGSENPKTVQLAKMFPESITVGGQVFNIHHNVTLDTLADSSLEFELAFYWTPRHLKQFPYFSDLLGHPKSFPNDLDLAQLCYVDDGDEDGKNRKVAYAVSDYTRAFYTILPDFLEEVDGLCCGAGIEFQVYSRPVDETETSEDEAEADEDENAEDEAE